MMNHAIFSRLTISGLWILMLFCSSLASAQWKDSTLGKNRVTQTIRPQKIALLIGIHHFKNPHWETLKYTRVDTEKMSRVLRRTARFDRILVRNTFTNTTRASLMDSLKELKGLVKSSHDTVFIYISGHGSVAYSPDRKIHRRFIITSDTTQNVSMTALSVNKILSYLRSYTSKRIILFLATCYTGAPMSKSRHAPGTKGGNRPLMPLRSRAVQILSASGYAQPAFESSLLKGDVYTHYFMQCLRDIHSKKRDVSAIDAHICAAKPTTLFVKKHRNEIQVPQVYSQPGANQDIPLTSNQLTDNNRGYLITPSFKTRLLRYIIRKVGMSRKGGKLVATANEEVALPPGRYIITVQTPDGKHVQKRTVQIRAGETTDWRGERTMLQQSVKKAAPKVQTKRKLAFFGVDLLPFVGTSSASYGEALRIFSFNIVAGISGGLRGLEVGSVLNIHKDSVYGVQIGGAANFVGGDLKGIHFGGVGNLVLGSALGLEIGGAMNFVNGSFSGVQLAGAFNFSRGIKGIQLGSLNVNAGELHGAQFGVANINTEGFRGFQLGVVNINAKEQGGPQLGVVNIHTGKEKGFQFGVFNYSRNSHLSLGLINIVANGRTHTDAWVSETGIFQIALKHGGDHFHSIVSLGGSALGQASWSVALGFGGHIPLQRGFFLDIDLLTQHINEGEGWTDGLNMLNTLRVVAGWRALPWLSVIAGVSYNMFISQKSDGSKYALFGDTVYVEKKSTTDLGVRGWPGFLVGLQFL